MASHFNELSGGLPWVCTRALVGNPAREDISSTIWPAVGYESTVWDMTVTVNPAKDRTYGWKRPAFVASTLSQVGCKPNDLEQDTRSGRGQHHGQPARRRHAWAATTGMPSRINEAAGPGPSPIVTRRVCGETSISGLRSSLPDRPVLSRPFVTSCFREGVQECEARIEIERALTDEAVARDTRN